MEGEIHCQLFAIDNDLALINRLNVSNNAETHRTGSLSLVVCYPGIHVFVYHTGSPETLAVAPRW